MDELTYSVYDATEHMVEGTPDNSLGDGTILDLNDKQGGNSGKAAIGSGTPNAEPIVLSHETALSVWRHARESGSRASGSRNRNRGNGASGRGGNLSSMLIHPHEMPYARLALMPERPPSDERVAAVIKRYPGFLSSPVDISIRDYGNRVTTSLKRTHGCSGLLPRRSLVKLSENDLLVVTPPLLLAQYSDVNHDKLALIRLAYELCGTYSHCPDGRVAYSRAPIARAKLLGTYCDRWAATQSGGQIRRGMTWLRDISNLVLDNSASPMETVVSMLGFLPHKLGGFGIPSPVLNYQIKLTDKERHLLKRRELYLDAYWENSKVALEYDSTMFHGTPKERTTDSKRRDFLLSKGITVITLTKDQVFNYALFHNVMMQLARQLRFRFRVRMRDWDRLHAQLRSFLLANLFAR